MDRGINVETSQFFGMSGREFDGLDFDAHLSEDEEDEDDGADRRKERVEKVAKEAEFRRSPLDLELEGGFFIPYELNANLFEYQRTGVRWLWELFSQKTGGIIGDEMGLGKTIQTISFLGGLRFSGLVTLPSLIVCPATIMNQWVEEFHKWWPGFRVAVVHHSSSQTPEKIIKLVQKSCGIVITSYDSLKVNQAKFLGVNWECVFLDEGHKIKNPDSEITLVAKRLRSPFRIILSGSPIQNKLGELWSLFDFVFPGKLGVPFFPSKFPFRVCVR